MWRFLLLTFCADKTVDNKSLHDTFSMFGNIVSVKVAQNKNTGESLGYGFVHFSTDEDAQKAIDKVNGMSINGSIVKVEAFKPRGDKDRAKSETFNNVYAKNFPETFTQQQLEEVRVGAVWRGVGWWWWCVCVCEYDEEIKSKS
jgi:polyadenylate-binding protein